MIKIKIKPELGLEFVPKKATEYSAGVDLFSSETFVLDAGKRALINTGIRIEIPNGYFGYIRPRSGLAAKYGIATCSSNVIDSDYRGIVFVSMINHSNSDFKIQKGDRIAQMLFLPVPEVVLEIVEQLDDTERSTGGFGSTGK